MNIGSATRHGIVAKVLCREDNAVCSAYKTVTDHLWLCQWGTFFLRVDRLECSFAVMGEADGVSLVHGGILDWLELDLQEQILWQSP